MPNFEVLDARIASALNKIIHNSHFKRRISLGEQKAQKQDRFFLGRQIAYLIYEYFRVVLVADLEKLETMDASEIYSKRLKAKEVIFPKENGNIFPVAGGRIKLLGGDQDLRTSTLIRHRPIQGESKIDFLRESEGSLPPPQDSFLDAGEAINDFWSMSGNFKNRRHVEPRVKLYSPREESFPIPLKYIDVSRITHTNLDVKQEKRIDDYWNIDGSRDLSDAWTGFTRFTLLEEKPPDGYMWSGERLTRKQLTSRPDHLWPELWKTMGKNAKLKEK